MTQKIKFIKQDAVVPIELGTDMISKFQHLLLYLVDERTQEELTQFTSEIKTEQPLSEPWMEHVKVVSVLLKKLEDKIIEIDLFVEKDITELDDLPVPPTP